MSSSKNPYPSSEVLDPSCVTIKLSGRDTYGLWITQMLCLLESHDMLDFIVETTNSRRGPQKEMAAGKEKMDELTYMSSWRRSDAVVKGWILGSLSEQALRLVVGHLKMKYTDYTAKDVWDTLKTTYGPRQYFPLRQEDTTVLAAGLNEDKSQERAKIHHMLYKATLTQDFEQVKLIVENEGVLVTDQITINGNTALHVAISTAKKKEFLEEMLKLVPDRSPILGLVNSEKSTLLHVAAIVGNLDVAKILVNESPDLLFCKDNEGYTPLTRASFNMHTSTYLYLLEETARIIADKKDVFTDSEGDKLLVNAFSSRDFESARKLLVMCGTVNSDALLMAMAHNFPDEPMYLTRKILYFQGVRTQREEAVSLLSSVCYCIRNTKKANSYYTYYTNPILEAARQDAYEVVKEIVSYFPDAIWSLDEDGHNIIQLAVIHRSGKVYNLLCQMSAHKNVYRTIKDSFGDNLLHLAARLVPAKKLNLISGAALQLQRELQWFKEVKRYVSPLSIIERNSFGETPQMVFTREHKDMVIEGEKWMKATAKSYTITTALIATIMFAAAITVPGGSDKGIAIFRNKTAFKIFAISDAISLFTSVTSLFMFNFSIFTTRFAEKDFLSKLPTKLIILLVTLFISTTAMLIAFCAAWFLVFGQSNQRFLIPLIAVLAYLLITSFVYYQIPLVVDLFLATYGRSIISLARKVTNPFIKLL